MSSSVNTLNAGNIVFAYATNSSFLISKKFNPKIDVMIDLISASLDQSNLISAPSTPIIDLTISITPKSIALSRTFTIAPKSAYNKSAPISSRLIISPSSVPSKVGYTNAANAPKNNTLIPCDCNMIFKILTTDSAFCSVMNFLTSGFDINSLTADKDPNSLLTSNNSSSANNCFNNPNSLSPSTACKSSSVTPKSISNACNAAKIISPNL